MLSRLADHAVVSFEQEPGRIITALANRKDPKLYLNIGVPQPAEGEETPEGYVVRFAPPVASGSLV